MDMRLVVDHAVAALEPGGEVVEVRPLTGGVSAEVVGVRVRTEAGAARSMVIRRHRAEGFKGQRNRVTAKEHALLVALHQDGLAVPEPFALHDSGDDIDPYLVMAWVDGSTGVATGELPAALEQMARFLARLHAWAAPSGAASVLDHIEDPRSSLHALLPAAGAAERLEGALVGGTLPAVTNRPVVLHGDYWPGNVLWRDGRLVAVIDWEDACLGDPLADLATARVELLCQYGDEAMELFTTCYVALVDGALSALDVAALPLWEAYVSAAALSTMHAWGLDPPEEAARRRRTEDHFERAVASLVP